MSVLRAFPFSVKLQCDNLVSHSGVGEYKKRTCVIPFKKCIKSSTIKSDIPVLYFVEIFDMADYLVFDNTLLCLKQDSKIVILHCEFDKVVECIAVSNSLCN